MSFEVFMTAGDSRNNRLYDGRTTIAFDGVRVDVFFKIAERITSREFPTDNRRDGEIIKVLYDSCEPYRKHAVVMPVIENGLVITVTSPKEARKLAV